MLNLLMHHEGGTTSFEMWKGARGFHTRLWQHFTCALMGIILKKFFSSYFLIFKGIKFLAQKLFSAEQRQTLLHCT
jgi:hypothetical protein